MAAQIADAKLTVLEQLQLEPKVVILHWCIKTFYQIQDIQKLTVTCMAIVKELISQITSKPHTDFKSADGKSELSQSQVDECLAQLLYLQRMIETRVHYQDATSAIKIFQDKILSKTENKQNFKIVKYYVKML